MLTHIYAEGFNARVTGLVAGHKPTNPRRKRVERESWEEGFSDANLLFNRAVAKSIVTREQPAYPVEIKASQAVEMHAHCEREYAQLRKELYGENAT